MVATASTEHPIGCKQQPIGCSVEAVATMIGCLRLARFPSKRNARNARTQAIEFGWKPGFSSDEPSCLRSFSITHQPAHNLQSSTLDLLNVTSPRTNLSSHAFRRSATAIWNNYLPADIRSANSLQVLDTSV